MKKVLLVIVVVILCVASFVIGRTVEATKPFWEGTPCEVVMENINSVQSSVTIGIENDKTISAIRMLAILKELQNDNTQKIEEECIKFLVQYFSESPELPDYYKESRDNLKARILAFSDNHPALKKQLTANQNMEPMLKTSAE